ncbi:MAG: hypothetical protein JWN71_3862, partial [Xanthobacteraceae bacterium]|nr:hypothetical protein [Xanthobacteraceae bacterium]
SRNSFSISIPLFDFQAKNYEVKNLASELP